MLLRFPHIHFPVDFTGKNLPELDVAFALTVASHELLRNKKVA